MAVPSFVSTHSLGVDVIKERFPANLLQRVEFFRFVELIPVNQEEDARRGSVGQARVRAQVLRATHRIVSVSRKSRMLSMKRS